MTAEPRRHDPGKTLGQEACAATRCPDLHREATHGDGAVTSRGIRPYYRAHLRSVRPGRRDRAVTVRAPSVRPTDRAGHRASAVPASAHHGRGDAREVAAPSGESPSRDPGRRSCRHHRPFPEAARSRGRQDETRGGGQPAAWPIRRTFTNPRCPRYRRHNQCEAERAPHHRVSRSVTISFERSARNRRGTTSDNRHDDPCRRSAGLFTSLRLRGALKKP
jgi:hypothetical protein